jgi:uncharacterized protein (DUF983 family)
MERGNHPQPAERDLRTSVLRGWRRRCPACGKGGLMQGYLTVRDRCPDCGEELFHQRADDGPAWATILITGHIMAPVMLIVYDFWRPEAWVMALSLSAIFLALSLALLPRLKGAFVGVQWAKRMHGFGDLRPIAPGA